MIKLFSFLGLTEADKCELLDVRRILTADISPESTKEKVRLLSVNKVTRIVERATKRIIEYKISQGMGRIRWAKFINELRWSLRDAGYSDEFVALISEAVIAKSVVMQKQAK